MMEPCRQDMSMFYSSSNNVVSPTHSTSVWSLGRAPVDTCTKRAEDCTKFYFTDFTKKIKLG